MATAVTDADLEEIFKSAVDVARKAGVLIKEAIVKEKQIETKDGFADLVTETDQRVERIVIDTLKQQFPSHNFIGEESVAAGEKCLLTEEPTWLIDPIDGTTNFVHRFPFVCISIGFAVKKQVVIGVVFNPVLDHMYTGRLGHGAFCNGEKISVSKAQDLNKSIVLTEYGNDRNRQTLETKLSNIQKIVEIVHGVRSAGSAAISMCLVAVGSSEVYYEYGPHCWDFAAADIIVREAGGVVLDAAGGEFDLMNRRVLCACNEEIAKQIVPLLSHVPYERD